ncbi:MAG: aminotransferase class V-fold PLP-dependent enzyme [Desulfurococcales archaeon]|nr:aminotransferase class V-fold PLP-dependent enzyme [Desulfurococcales archaeon]
MGGCVRRLSVIGAMISKPPEPARRACKATLHTNLGDPGSYPGLIESARTLLEKVIGITVDGEASAGFTSGATEANILALYYWRRKGRRRVVAPATAHYSVRKAASLLGMEIRTVPGDPEQMLDALSSGLDDRDVLVLTVGTTEEGRIDPVEEALEIAGRRGVPVHVDAAFAGLVMKWLPRPVRLRLEEPMGSVAVDLHKLGEAPMPLGVILAGEDLINELYFEAPYIPSGSQFGVLGSRPGCPVFAAHASLHYLEQTYGSFKGMAAALMRAADQIIGELEPYGYTPTRKIETPIMCLQHKLGREIHLSLQRIGVKAYSCVGGRGVRIAVMPHHIYDGELECITYYLKLAASPFTSPVRRGGWLES